jgi:hypothetical protein
VRGPKQIELEISEPVARYVRPKAMHACYDYCAAWKEPAQQEDGAGHIEAQR